MDSNFIAQAYDEFAKQQVFVGFMSDEMAT